MARSTSKHKVSTPRVVDADELAKAHNYEAAKEAAIKKAVALAIRKAKKAGK